MTPRSYRGRRHRHERSSGGTVAAHPPARDLLRHSDPRAGPDRNAEIRRRRQHSTGNGRRTSHPGRSRRHPRRRAHPALTATHASRSTRSGKLRTGSRWITGTNPGRPQPTGQMILTAQNVRQARGDLLPHCEGGFELARGTGNTSRTRPGRFPNRASQVRSLPRAPPSSPRRCRARRPRESCPGTTRPSWVVTTDVGDGRAGARCMGRSRPSDRHTTRRSPMIVIQLCTGVRIAPSPTAGARLDVVGVVSRRGGA